MTDRARATVDSDGHVFLELDADDPDVGKTDVWLTSDQARALAAQLTSAADQANNPSCRCGHPNRKRYTHRAESPCIKH